MISIAYVVYKNGDFIIKKSICNKHRPYKVINTKYKDDSKHTHLHTEKEAIDLVNYARHEHLPQSANIDYLISLLRIIDDNVSNSKYTK